MGRAILPPSCVGWGSASAKGGPWSLAVLTGVEGFRGDNPGPKEGGLSFFCESP